MIALIGKSGVGKTTFLKILEKKGFKILIADNFVKNIYKKGAIGYKKILEAFGTDLVNDEGVDKKALRERLLSQPEFINALEKVIFPILEDHLKNNYYDVVEIPALFSPNANFEEYFDKIIRIEISEKNRHLNLQKRNVNNRAKNVIDTINKGFFKEGVVNIFCTKVTTKRFFEQFFKIYFETNYN